MATIGKDGKDDSARLASLGGGAASLALESLASSLSSSTRYYRAVFDGFDLAAMANQVEFAEKMTLIGFIDSYGSSGQGEAFIVVNGSSEEEALAVANLSPLVLDGGASVSVQSLNSNSSIWV